MARREGEYLFARRVADRGNDMSVFYSRARGEDRHPTRRVADRGSDGIYLDPRDLKIKRLRQLVRDLEEIKRLRRVRDLEDIKRLRQRVRDLELKREMRVKETESETIVRDDVNEEEEYPFDHPHPRFNEPIYQESFSEDEPRFDVDGIEPDEEEYLWARQAVNGVPNREEEEKEKKVHKSSKVSPGMFDEFMDVYTVASMVAFFSKPYETGFPLGRDLTKDPIIIGIQNGPNLSVVKNNLIVCDKDVAGDNYVSMHNFKRFENKNGGKKSGIHNFDLFTRLTHHIHESLEIGLKVYDGPHNITDNHIIVSDPDFNSHTTKRVGPNRVLTIEAQQMPVMETQIQFGAIPFISYAHATHYSMEFQVNEKRFSGPFDPGGIGQEPDETTRKVRLFRRVMMIIVNGNRVDVPFDPGGFEPKAKLEDEFFSKRRSMMQGYLLI
ncbi:hypothetical protein HanPI659440_Chr14g0573311 [Helianthus annuus]|nr:hypothetical protein HanPI659440_Chr14g0573311 [Helianthus annuus]